jgi:para-nitrobenzyl esterase
VGESSTVEVGSGLLRGSLEAGTWVFRGIPYASTGSRAPGSLKGPGKTAGRPRWRRPEPVEPWKGVRDALSWGPNAPQPPPTPGLSIPGDPVDRDEECLNLNIWTPALDDAGRPVLVWVHGGGFTSGSGASALFRGDRLSRRGDVVVVTINYRLGALGFLAHGTLAVETANGITDGLAGLGAATGGGEPACGNWGLWDQLAALDWVRQNIAAFGGDPHNVTLFGESAGAMSIASLLATEAAGLSFHKAVIQSGPPATAGLEWCERRAERLGELAGCTGFDVERMLSITADELVAATGRLASEAPRAEGLPLPLLPVVDGALLRRPPAESIADGEAAGVPLLIGTTRDEAALFVLTDPRVRDLDREKVVRRIARVTTLEAASELVEAYRAARQGRGEPVGERDLLVALVTDYVFRVPSVNLADASYKHQNATYSYLFSWESPFLGGAFGASHGLEIPFVFGTVEEEAIATFTGSGEDASRLSSAVQDAWLAFAKTADPSCDSLGEWPAYDPLRRPTMELGMRSGVVEDPRAPERLAWEQVGVEIAPGHHHELRDR